MKCTKVGKHTCSAWIDISKPSPCVCSGFVNPLRAVAVVSAFYTSLFYEPPSSDFLARLRQ